MILLAIFAGMIVWVFLATLISIPVAEWIRKSRERQELQIEAEREANRAQVVRVSKLDIVV